MLKEQFLSLVTLTHFSDHSLTMIEKEIHESLLTSLASSEGDIGCTHKESPQVRIRSGSFCYKDKIFPYLQLLDWYFPWMFP